MTEFLEAVKAIESGDSQAADRLFPLVYDQLRRLAAVHLSQERPGHTLQPTALVHEAYLRLVGGSASDQWKSREHFFSAAAVSIRRILIDHARSKQAAKRGGEYVRRELDDIPTFPQPREDILALDEALTRLAEMNPAAAELVQLCYFTGLSHAEAAQIMNVSERTTRRLWTYARAWLRREIENDETSEAN